MADEATRRLRIEAHPDRIWEVLTDFERYPAWAADIKDARVVSRDEQGRAQTVAFRAAAMGRSVQYTLSYDYRQAPHRLAWTLAEGDIMRTLDGAYHLDPTDGGVDVTYHLEVELAIPLPGFVKRRAESKIVSTALRSLRRHVEAD